MTSVSQEAAKADIPTHVLVVGKKNALDYIAPSLFRIGACGELLVKAKGSLSIVTAVNVAEMVKRDVPGLETRSIKIGTEEFVANDIPRRVSYIEIHLARTGSEQTSPAVETLPSSVSVDVAETHVAHMDEVVSASPPVVEKPSATDTEIPSTANKKKMKTRAKIKTTAKKRTGTSTKVASNKKRVTRKKTND